MSRRVPIGLVVVTVVVLAAVVMGVGLWWVGGYRPVGDGPSGGVVTGAEPATDVPWPLPQRCLDPVARSDTDGISVDVTDVPGIALAHYAVTDGVLDPVDGTDPDGCDGDLWQVVRAVFPAAQVDRISDLVVFDSSPDSDEDRNELGETVAYVEPKRDLSEWVLAVNPFLEDSGELADSLVHEFGHLYTLSDSQIDPASAGEDCGQTQPTAEGCTLPDSLLNSYLRDAWDPAIRAEWNALDIRPDDAASQERVADFYDQHPDDFVSEYAASDPEEDFSETLAAWCLDRPMNTAPLRAKARFLDGRRELAGLRQGCSLLER